MSEPVVLPALGESVTEGTVTRWLKQLGDRIEVDEPLLEVSTDKVDTEIPSPIAGVLEEILVQEDETAEVGAALARIGDGSGVSSSASSLAAQPEPPSQPDAAAEPGQSSSAEPSSAESAPAAAVSNGAAAASNDAASVPEETGSEDRASQDGATQDVVLPSLGESITEGTVTRWLKAPGDRVAVDEPLLEVSTDKVDTEVPSPVEGVVQEILAQEDETVEVGAALARIATGSGGSHAEAPAESKPAPRSAPPAETPAVPEAEAPSPAEPDATAAEPQPAPAARSEEPARSDEPAQQQAAQPEPAQQQAAQPRPAATPESTPAASAGYVTPIVRKLAHQLGVDIATVTGRGVGGRIRKEDVQEAADRAATNADSAEATAPASSAPAATISELRGTTQKMSRLRKVIAERAVASLQATAQLTTVVEVDVTRIAQLRQAKKEEFLERSGNKLSFLPFFALAAAEALRSHPIINATVDGDQIVYPDTENISIAVDTERGLLTPVVRDAGEKNIAQLAADIADLARRTRENTLTPDELSGGTFTLTNTGSRGALFDTPLVFMPQVAILGTGTVVRKPVVVSGAEGDAIAIRSIVYLALSYDHRIVDGADAARFLTQVKERLEAGDFTDRLGL